MGSVGLNVWFGDDWNTWNSWVRLAEILALGWAECLGFFGQNAGVRGFFEFLGSVGQNAWSNWLKCLVYGFNHYRKVEIWHFFSFGIRSANPISFSNHEFNLFYLSQNLQKNFYIN